MVSRPSLFVVGLFNYSQVEPEPKEGEGTCIDLVE